METVKIEYNKPEAAELWKKWEVRQQSYAFHGWDRDASLEFVLEVIGPVEGRILDVGAGRGAMTRALLRQGAGVVAVDNSFEALRENGLMTTFCMPAASVAFVHGDAGSLGFPDDSFDMVVACYVLHHLERMDTVLAECARLVSSNGRIALADFTEKGFELLNKVNISEGNGGHVMPKESAVLKARDYLRRCGFKTQRFGESFVEVVVAAHEFT